MKDKRQVGGNDTTGMGGNDTTGGGGTMTGGGGAAGGGGGGGSQSSGTALQQTIADYATSASVCIVFINAWSGEGADRSELRNTEQDDLVISVASECNNTMVVVNTVGARIVDSWIENENITAVVYGGLLGQESGHAIMDVLYGDVSLPETRKSPIITNHMLIGQPIRKTSLHNRQERIRLQRRNLHHGFLRLHRR